MKHWLTRKDPDARKDWRQEEKGPTEVEMVKWHHQLDEHEFEQALGVGDGQGKPIVLQSMGSQSRTRLNNWIKLNILTQLKQYSYYMYMKAKVTQSCLTLRPHELYSPRNSPSQNIGVGSFSLLQGIFPTQESNPGLPYCKRILYQLSYQRSPLKICR